MDYYEIRTIDGKRIEWGIFASDADAVRWYMRGVWEGWLYKKCGSWFNRVHTEATPKTEATRLAELLNHGNDTSQIEREVIDELRRLVAENSDLRERNAALGNAQEIALDTATEHALRADELRDRLAAAEAERDQLARWKSTNAPRLEALDGLLADARAEAAKGAEAISSLASEREANAILTAENDQLRAQVERLQGGEPVAWRVRRHDAPKYWIVFLHKPVDALQDPDREVQPLYTPAAPSQEPVPDGLVAYSQHLDKHITAQEPVTLTEREIGDCIDKTNREKRAKSSHKQNTRKARKARK